MALVWAVAWSTGCSKPKPQAAGPPPAVPVTVAPAALQTVPLQVQAVGSVEPYATVQVKSQIAGEIRRVHFTEGTDIKKDDLLFEIDPRPYQEALRQAEAALARDNALYRQAEANLARDRAQLKFAEADAGRYQELVNSGVVSKSQFEQYRTNADSLHEAARADQAAIESARASIDSDKAAVDRAKLDLTFCEIRAPISGRAGNLLVNAGNLVKANGDNAMVVLNQITPIFVSFGVPEQYLAAVRSRSAKEKLLVDAAPQGDPSSKAIGTLHVIDNTVDASTGTIKLKAIFPNQEKRLWPGQFVNVALTLDRQKGAVVIPSEAVQSGQKGQFVFVVKSDQSVELRPVSLGPVVSGKTVVENGVAAGETVVTDGQLRLFPGARIQAVPASKIESQGT
jgi:membrane fusion protein, multidrug efflux system